METWDSDIQVSTDEEPKDLRDLIRKEVDKFSQRVAKLPNSGGPLTFMERGVLLAYLHHKLTTERTQK